MSEALWANISLGIMTIIAITLFCRCVQLYNQLEKAIAEKDRGNTR